MIEHNKQAYNVTIGEKLKLLRQLKKMTVKELAKQIGMSPQHISRIENNHITNVSIQTIEKLVQPLGLTVAQFLEWDPTEPKSVLGRDKQPASATPSTKIPILNYIPMDYPRIQPNNAYVDDYIDVPFISPQKDLFALKVKGDSIHLEIQDGDIVVVPSHKYVVKGDTVACVYNSGELLIKKYYPYDNYVTLISVNPAYEPITIPKQKIRFIGKVILIIHQLR